MDYRSLAEQAEQQHQLLLRLIGYVNTHSPFYQSVFHEQNIDFSDGFTLDQFKRIPFTEKEHLQQRNWDFLCIPKEKVAEYSATTGTLGNPVTIALSAADLDRLAFNEALSFQLMGLSSTDTVQLLLTLDRQFMAGMAYYMGLRKMNIPVIRSGPGLPAMQIEIARQLNASVWVAVPSFILHLCTYAQQTGFDLHQLPVKKILCIGENIRDEQWALNQLALRIKNQWSVQLFSTYASTEMQTAFTECEQGMGTHHHPELVYIEIMDAHGQEVADGEYGEVVISTLGVEAMPLLRYKTGDIAKKIISPCACGRTTLRLSPILGRKKHMIKYKGTTIYPSALYEVLHGYEGISDYVVEVKHNEFHEDEITLYLHTYGHATEQEGLIKAYLKAKLRFVPHLIFKTQDDIQRLLFSAGTRKAQKFIDLRNPDSHE